MVAFQKPEARIQKADVRGQKVSYSLFVISYWFIIGSASAWQGEALGEYGCRPFNS